MTVAQNMYGTKLKEAVESGTSPQFYQ